jgi:ArsR family transcriptional regulator
MSTSPAEPAELFRAFADPTRLRILSLLAEQKELCVCDLCEVLDEIQPKVSRHLAALRRVRLVHGRRDGKWMFYSLADSSSPLQRTLLRCVRTCLSGFEVLAADRRRLRALELRLRCA